MDVAAGNQASRALTASQNRLENNVSNPVESIYELDANLWETHEEFYGHAVCSCFFFTCAF